jgi:hypothetical protein
MKTRLLRAFRRNEIYVVAIVVGVVFAAAMTMVGLLLKTSIVTPPYETLSDGDLKHVFATAYLRFREDDGTPYLKIELHNGTLWWIKRVEFDFQGTRYSLNETDAFRPLHFGAVRCGLKKSPEGSQIEYDLHVLKAAGHPPAQLTLERDSKKIAEHSKESGTRN